MTTQPLQTRPADGTPGVDATERAATLLDVSLAGTTRTERRRQSRLAKVVDDEALRELTFALTDEVLRLDDPRRAARRFAAVVRRAGSPQGLGPVDRVALAVGGRLAPLAPRLVMPMVRRRLLAEAEGVVLSADDPAFADHVQRRTHEGFRLNVNVLGEAILSDAEADARMAQLRERIARSDVTYVSLKISAVCADLDVLAFDSSVARIAERLRDLYRLAASSSPTTFVNLDMEEYRDLPLTIAAMTAVLDEPEFVGLDAGIVLQAYLPDSHDACRELCEWAVARHRRGGGTLKIRVVKGANLAMERVEAELHGWPQAPYATKAEVDASFKRLVMSALDDRWGSAVRVGVASHNLFDVAWALGLPGRDRIDLEMLEGMAPAQARAVLAEAGDVLLYAPVVRLDDLPSSIAYLTRRLDENTSPDNFLRSLFTLRPGSETWHDQRARFEQALLDADTVSTTSRRLQSRPTAPTTPQYTELVMPSPAPARPEHDKFELTRVASGHPAQWAPLPENTELVMAPPASARSGHDTFGEVGAGSGAGSGAGAWGGVGFRNAADTDWTRAVNRRWIGEALADPPVLDVPVLDTVEQIDRVVATARASSWRDVPAVERKRVLLQVAEVMELERGATLSLMAHEAAKTIAEGDPEVSEAVDFARYYAASIDTVAAPRHSGATFEPFGVVVVAAPWNFPYAIPAGGVLAALAAGNAVVLKPAPEVRSTALHLARQLWAAGVPADAVQFVACPDDEVGRRLMTHPDVGAVVLTGAYETAMRFLDWRPDMRLFAETSGKNAMVITAAADEDAAIKDLVKSAFGHAGQKCSAASLAIVEASLHDDGTFLRRLADAVRSLRVGPATDLATTVGPLIGSPSPALHRALTTLDEGESWLVEPVRIDERTWTPGVRLGVRPGSWFHRTECFGPVLGIVRATDLDDAIAIQNSSELGLTGGIQSLDETEVARWLERVEVGNAYVNRHITGAVVQRQPFGGWKRSSVGGGPKAGGPHYVSAFGTWTGGGDGAAEMERVWGDEFVPESDPSGLLCERNVLRHRPLGRVALVVADDADPALADVARTAARVAGVQLCEPAAGADRVRVIGRVADEQLRAWRAAGLDIDLAPPVADALIELRHWVHEQSLSITRHRHGRLLDSR